MGVGESIDPIAADLKKIGLKIDEQNEFIFLYVNIMFFALMIYGNIMFFGKTDEVKTFCQRTSGYFQQLMSITFLLILFGYPQMIYYGTMWCRLTNKKCFAEEEE